MNAPWLDAAMRERRLGRLRVSHAVLAADGSLPPDLSRCLVPVHRSPDHLSAASVFTGYCAAFDPLAPGEDPPCYELTVVASSGKEPDAVNLIFHWTRLAP